jgi:hypothetical protein
MHKACRDFPEFAPTFLSPKAWKTPIKNGVKLRYLGY